MGPIRLIASALLVCGVAAASAPAQASFSFVAVGMDGRYPTTINATSFSYGGRRIGVYAYAYSNGLSPRLGGVNRSLTINISFATFDSGPFPEGFSATMVTMSTINRAWRSGVQSYFMRDYPGIWRDVLGNAILPPSGFYASGGPYIPPGTIMQTEITVRTPKGTRVVRLPVQVSYPIIYFQPTPGAYILPSASGS